MLSNTLIVLSDLTYKTITYSVFGWKLNSKTKSIYMEHFIFPLTVDHKRDWILNDQLILL
jgi:hypothetical protein